MNYFTECTEDRTYRDTEHYIKVICNMTMNEQINAIYVNKKSTTTNKQKFLLHILETEVIILSSFPKPVMGKFGYIYEIPRVHCKIKECQIDDCLTNGSRETKTSCNRGTEYQRVFSS